jgi:chaperonin GroEL
LGLQEGVAPGGGAAFLACLPALATLRLPDDEAIATSMLQNALLAPMRTMIQNAGFEAEPIIAQIRQHGPACGFDVEQGQICHMVEANLVDPVKVLQVALHTAVSGAIMALTTEALVHKPRSNRERDVDLNP